MADHDHDIKELNALLTTLVDSVDGFQKASEAADTSQAKAAFDEVRTERQGIINNFEGEIRRLGGTPEEKGSILAAAHRATIGLREKLQDSDAAVADEALRGEDYLRSEFEDAAADEKLTAETRSFVARHATLIVKGRDRIARLKSELDTAGK